MRVFEAAAISSNLKIVNAMSTQLHVEISVVIPSLNSEKTIGVAIRSAMEHAD